jgi:hypothetical protein
MPPPAAAQNLTRAQCGWDFVESISWSLSLDREFGLFEGDDGRELAARRAAGGKAVDMN